MPAPSPSITYAGFFRVPVRGVMTKTKIILPLGETESGPLTYFEKQADVRLWMLSVLSMKIHRVFYALPCKDGPFVFTRVNGGQPIECDVQRNGNSMFIEKHMERTRFNPGARGEYKLEFHACNPSCGGGH
jgi:hypothetical protein